MKLNNAFLGAFLCMAGFSVMAASLINDDLSKQVEINAANQFADIKNKRVVYGGPVVVTQGSIKLNADELTAYTDEKTGERILIATGNPATYQQMIEINRTANASANEIQYNIDNRIMTLIGKAKVKQDDSEVTAEKIIYDINNQKLEAQSNNNGNGHVTTIIQPEDYQSKDDSDKKQ